MNALHPGKDEIDLLRREHDRALWRRLWPVDAFNPEQLYAKDGFIEEQQRAQRLRIGRAGHIAVIDETGHGRLDFRRSHFLGMAQAMEADVPSCPAHIRAFGTEAVMFLADTAA